MAQYRSPLLALLAATLLCLGGLTCQGQTSAFTYQGKLSADGAPANGNFDFQFRIYSALSGGSLIAGPITMNSVAVTAGVFTVTLDAGTSPFDGSARFLEIAVRNTGAQSAHTILAPRQPITSVPYAIRAASGSGSTDASSITMGTLPDNVLSVNIPRLTDLTTLSNSLVAQINGIMVGDAPSGVVVASSSANDTALTGQGLQNIGNLASPAWIDGSSANQPLARSGHTTLWTGLELLVWGGNVGAGQLSASGGTYVPGTDTWTPLSTIDAPAARAGHTAVWTGTDMVVWGGSGTGGYLATGGRYRRDLQQWLPVSATSAPGERQGHVAIWNGTRMLIWSGQDNSGLLNNGALYEPTSDVWTTLDTANPPTARRGATAVWTGSAVVVWGGEGTGGELNTGGRLNFNGGGTPTSWQSTSLVNAPSARRGQVAVWTGSRMLVWGGENSGTALATGASYDPVSDTWTALPTAGAPAARTLAGAVWTGSEMVVFGGESSGVSLASGGAYNPTTGLWRTLGNPGSPIARSSAGTVWSGTELLVFGGLSNGTPTAGLQRLNPQPTWYLYRKP